MAQEDEKGSLPTSPLGFLPAGIRGSSAWLTLPFLPSVPTASPCTNAQKFLGLMLPVLGACQDQDQHFIVKVLNSWESQIDSGKITLITQGWILLDSFLQVNEQLRKKQ